MWFDGIVDADSLISYSYPLRSSPSAHSVMQVTLSVCPERVIWQLSLVRFQILMVLS